MLQKSTRYSDIRLGIGHFDHIKRMITIINEFF